MMHKTNKCAYLRLLQVTHTDRHHKTDLSWQAGHCGWKSPCCRLLPCPRPSLPTQWPSSGCLASSQCMPDAYRHPSSLENLIQYPACLSSLIQRHQTGQAGSLDLHAYARRCSSDREEHNRCSDSSLCTDSQTRIQKGQERQEAAGHVNTPMELVGRLTDRVKGLSLL